MEVWYEQPVLHDLPKNCTVIRDSSKTGLYSLTPELFLPLQQPRTKKTENYLLLFAVPQEKHGFCLNVVLNTNLQKKNSNKIFMTHWYEISQSFICQFIAPHFKSQHSTFRWSSRIISSGKTRSPLEIIWVGFPSKCHNWKEDRNHAGLTLAMWYPSVSNRCGSEDATHLDCYWGQRFWELTWKQMLSIIQRDTAMAHSYSSRHSSSTELK